MPAINKLIHLNEKQSSQTEKRRDGLQTTHRVKKAFYPKVVNKKPMDLHQKVRSKLEQPGDDMPPATCAMKKEVFYLKIHKTGSSTITGLLDRVALRYKLTTLPIEHDIYPGTLLDPFITRVRNHVLPESFDTFGEHFAFNETEVRRFVGPDPVFIASIRQPFSQIRSLFKEYAIPIRLKITHPDPVATFLSNLEYYEPLLDNYIVFVKNVQARNFGIPAIYHNNKTYVLSYIEYLKKTFDLILVREHFDHSLVLLKRKLCWEMKDIIYLPMRVNPSKKVQLPTNPYIKDLHRNYSPADYQLYTSLLKIFNDTVRNQTNFQSELETFRNINQRINAFCEPIIAIFKRDVNVVYSIASSSQELIIERTPWSTAFTIHPMECLIMKLDTVVFRNILKIRLIPSICDSPDFHRIQDNSHAYGNVRMLNKTTIVVHPSYCKQIHPKFKVPLELFTHIPPQLFYWTMLRGLFTNSHAGTHVGIN